jgi:hypothetical protein
MNKIFNIGLNRAGTTSLAEALRLLGFSTAHYRHRGVRLYDLIIHNARRGRRLFDGLEEQCDAFSDFAGRHFYAELDRQYPGSKFILTTRELDGWLDSRERKVLLNRARPDYRYGFLAIDREGWARERAAYVSRLQAHFAGRPGDLLVIDIPAGEGWDRLCPFLGVPAPDRPFPWQNRSNR